MKKILFPLIFLIGSLAHASIAADDASNYASWTNGSNQGTGFAAWSLNNNDNGSTIFAGNFLGNSTDGAGDINTGGQAFGLYANPSGAFSTAIRSFSMSVGETFTAQMGVNFDNGNKGFNFRIAGDSIFNFNVGGGGSVSSPNATLNPGTGAGYNYGGNDAVIDLSLTLDTATQLSYVISRNSSQGFQGTLFSGTVTGLSAAPDNFEFYISDTDGGGAAQNNLYFNNLRVIPEPETAMLLICGLGLISLLRRQRAKV
ncbi:MAG: PEP-CTERM sorting domain-containing protein [Kiritimatiellia bacterium]